MAIPFHEMTRALLLVPTRPIPRGRAGCRAGLLAPNPSTNRLLGEGSAGLSATGQRPHNRGQQQRTPARATSEQADQHHALRPEHPSAEQPTSGRDASVAEDVRTLIHAAPAGTALLAKIVLWT